MVKYNVITLVITLVITSKILYNNRCKANKAIGLEILE